MMELVFINSRWQESFGVGVAVGGDCDGVGGGVGGNVGV